MFYRMQQGSNSLTGDFQWKTLACVLEKQGEFEKCRKGSMREKVRGLEFNVSSPSFLLLVLRMKNFVFGMSQILQSLHTFLLLRDNLLRGPWLHSR
ncbi:uncharacterized protein LOC116267841 isoform X4 [Nymphaea colorata]|uniref:uncharacterized protein LOC116267841 isoform X4 n=1 Tax=Nymphaea colorata TaxID=210225 RepID=UPI00214E209B|nr:uncharacterized protein LOC116267841 isoform X4 [Nymphaea colorata]